MPTGAGGNTVGTNDEAYTVHVHVLNVTSNEKTLSYEHRSDSLCFFLNLKKRGPTALLRFLDLEENTDRPLSWVFFRHEKNGTHRILPRFFYFKKT